MVLFSFSEVLGRKLQVLSPHSGVKAPSPAVNENFLISAPDADEQQHPDHRPRHDGGRRQAAHQAAAAGLRPLPERSQDQHGAGPGDGGGHRPGRGGEGGREEDDPQHHREAVPLLHQRQDSGAPGPGDGQRRQGR